MRHTPLSCVLLSLVFAVSAINTKTSAHDDTGADLPADEGSLPGLVSGDFEGPVRKITVLLMIKQISDEIHKLFATKTEFESIERALLKNDTKVEYIFPGEAEIIEGIGKLVNKISKFIKFL